MVENKEDKVQIKDILDLVEQITPNSNEYHQVPVFYRSLMSSTSRINDEFWVNRDYEMKQIKNALQRHKNGLGGAVLIKGVHGAGKTSLSRYAASHLFHSNAIFWIKAPVNGSIEIQDLLNEIRKQVVSPGDFSDIFENIPHNSVIVLNDLELWWERSSTGHHVIEKIIDLIAQFSKKIFFILNCNTFSFHIMNKLFSIEDHLLALIECENFNTGQLQSLILSRHKSSGLTLKYNGKHEDDMSQLNTSLLFNSYFSISGGVPGIAMNTWKANITGSDQESITIKKPKKPNVDILSKLDTDWLTIIALFIQHKTMSPQKLERITGYDPHYAKNAMDQLFNSGLIVSKENDAFTLGRNIEPYLVEVCVQKGII